MDMDLQTGLGQDDSMFGIDNVGLDFNDFEILNGKISDGYKVCCFKKLYPSYSSIAGRV